MNNQQIPQNRIAINPILPYQLRLIQQIPLIDQQIVRQPILRQPVLPPQQPQQQQPKEQEEPIIEDLIHCQYPNLASNVICKICFYLIQRPILVCNTCGYFACSKCILTWQSNPQNARCPLKCNAKPIFTDKPIPNLEVILNVIKIKCKYSLNKTPEDQCPEMFAYSDQSSLKAHQKDCPYKMIVCSFPGCTQQICLNNAPKHYSSCSFNKSPCSFCGELIQTSSVQKHQNLCEQRLIQCPLNGCFQQIKLTDKEQHIKQCQYRLKICEGCNEEVPNIEAKDHYKTCQKIRVDCKVCKSPFPRCSMQQHLDQDCPEFIIECEKCKERTTRKQMMNHNEDNCIQYLVKRLNKAEERKEGCQQKIQYFKRKLFISG